MKQAAVMHEVFTPFAYLVEFVNISEILNNSVLYKPTSYRTWKIFREVKFWRIATEKANGEKKFSVTIYNGRIQ